MAKQKKPVITARIEQLKSLGYESVTDGQGAYQTIRELDRLTIERKDIEYQTDDEWQITLAKVEADHSKHLPLTESETVEQEQTTPTANLQELVVRVEKEAETSIGTFDANKARIAEWKNKYGNLKFSGDLKDTANNALIEEGWRTARTARLALEKREAFVKAPFIAASKKIGSVADEFYVLLAEIEKPLKEQRDLIEAAKEAEKNRLAIEAEKEGTRRVDVLKEAGMKFDGQFYCIADRSMDYSTIKAMTPEAFEDLLEKVKGDKKRLDELEAQELQQLKEVRKAQRTSMLMSIGMKRVDMASEIGESYFFTELLEGVKIGMLTLTDEPDDKFMALFSSISGRIAEAKQKEKDDADKKAKERTVALRSKLIIAAGLAKVDWIPGTTQTGFYFKNDFVEIKLPMPCVESDTDDEFDARLEQYETQITEAKAAALKKEDDDAKARQLAQDRGQQLVALGMTRAPHLSCFIFNLPDVELQCSVAYGELTGQSAEAWDNTIMDVTGAIVKIREAQQAFEDKAAKDKKDREEKEAADLIIFQERQYKLVNLGMVIVENVFTVRNEFGDCSAIAIEEVKALDADVWPRRLAEITEDVDRVKRLTISKRQQAIDEAEALKPEIQRAEEKINAVWDLIKDTTPESFSGDVACRFSVFYDDVYKAVNAALGSLGNLKKQ